MHNCKPGNQFNWHCTKNKCTIAKFKHGHKFTISSFSLITGMSSIKLSQNHLMCFNLLHQSIYNNLLRNQANKLGWPHSSPCNKSCVMLVRLYLKRKRWTLIPGTSTSCQVSSWLSSCKTTVYGNILLHRVLETKLAHQIRTLYHEFWWYCRWKLEVCSLYMPTSLF